MAKKSNIWIWFSYYITLGIILFLSFSFLSYYNNVNNYYINICQEKLGKIDFKYSECSYKLSGFGFDTFKTIDEAQISCRQRISEFKKDIPFSVFCSEICDIEIAPFGEVGTFSAGFSCGRFWVP